MKVPPSDSIENHGIKKFRDILIWQDNSTKGRRRAEEKCPLPAALALGEDAGQQTESSAAHGACLLSPEVQCTM